MNMINISTGIVLAISPMQATITEALPKEIIAEGQWVIADMDGTLIGAPGYKKEPTLGESVAQEAIFNWLRAGGHLLVSTGCETQRVLDKFAHFIPKDLEKALLERRLLLATNGGAIVSYFDGDRWTEDPNYRDSAMQTRIAISKDNATLLLENSVSVINDFYRDLRENENLIPEILRNKYKAIAEIARSKHDYDFKIEELVTLNTDIVPRIEIRRAETGEVVQICIIGIPTDLEYDVSKLKLDSIGNLDLCKIGVTHEINIKDVDKALPVRWLKKGQLNYPKLSMKKSVAVGDRPNHNDAPLTTVVGAFVSVCENNSASYIPEHVTLKIGHNENGTKQLLERLLEKAKKFNKITKLEPVIVNTLDEVVEESIDFFSH